MAAAVLRPYDVDLFNGIPSLGEANEQFLAHNGPEVIILSLWKLFSKYKLTDQYGPVLVHRHWPASLNEAVVDVNGTSTAWTLEAGEQTGMLQFEKYERPIKPSSWMMVKGQLMPYEFYFASQKEHDEPAPLDSAFVQEFASILEANSLLDFVGIRLLRHTGQKVLEVTEGNANVTFPVTDDDQNLLEKNAIQAGWKFPSAEPPDFSSDTSGNMGDRSPWSQACKQLCKQSCSIICRKPSQGGSHMRVHLGGHSKTHGKTNTERTLPSLREDGLAWPREE
ncbi:hypothetical protein J3458_019535 [Metarhizium acridum]|uniref:uncharacterized protein n=1 Tax=Metarhizium acridum TaxID=92637 RepID=UPI001C6AF292|nr:hypothetical protein J3458_019535 [Metarhizium acridum]